jgi:CubicO group peptidase (beta-lactamase class C family)
VLDGQKPANTAAIRADVVPGTIWRYAGGGYTVMQQLLMDVTGRPFPLLLADLVLRPIGMKDSTYEQPLPEARRAAAASGHLTDGGLLPGRYHTYPEMAAAGLWTTPTDLARFLMEIQQALQGRSKILTPAMARQMVTVQKGSYGLGLVYLALLVNAVGMVLLAATGVDVLTSITAVVACMFNIGPGLGLVGPAEHYGHLPALAKWVLSVAMIAGRLEFYTLVVVLTPTFWRR